jgi:hypothetical protein
MPAGPDLKQKLPWKIIKALPAPIYAVWGNAFGFDKDCHVAEDDVAAWYLIAIGIAVVGGVCNLFGWLNGVDMGHYILLAGIATLICRLAVVENDTKKLKETIAELQRPVTPLQR